MKQFSARDVSRMLLSPLVAGLLYVSCHPALAADDPDAPNGAAVTVLKSAKSCFSNLIEVSGIVIAREENAVRP
jgi:HlyD family secretion protein